MEPHWEYNGFLWWKKAQGPIDDEMLLAYYYLTNFLQKYFKTIFTFYIFNFFLSK